MAENRWVNLLNILYMAETKWGKWGEITLLYIGIVTPLIIGLGAYLEGAFNGSIQDARMWKQINQRILVRVREMCKSEKTWDGMLFLQG